MWPKGENGALLVFPGSWAEDVGKQDQIYSSCDAEQQFLFPCVPATSLWPGYRLSVLEEVQEAGEVFIRDAEIQ